MIAPGALFRMSTDLLSLVRAAGERPGAAGLLAIGADAVSGAEIARRVERLAAGLKRAGFGDGDRLAVVLERSIEEAVAVLAAAAAGGLAVPVNSKLKDDQIAHLLRDAEPWGVVTSAVRLLALRDPAAVLRDLRVFRVGDQVVPVAATPLADCDADPESMPAPSAAAAAILLYTSGSTGLAKGVVQTHGNLTRGAAIVADYLGLSRDDHILSLLPLSFDYGLNQLLSALYAGCRITAADHLAIGELAELLLTVRPTGFAGVPSLFHEIASGLETGVLTDDHGASLRYVTNTGGALRREDSTLLRARWPHTEVYAMYGLTEAFRSAFLPPTEFDRHPDSFGRAIAGVELLLVDPATGAVLDGAAEGELVHAGALVAAGYWRDAEATAARFRADPRGGGATVVYSGDLVRRDAAGRLRFVGRRDRMLKVHGHRVSPDEVAAVFVGVAGAGRAIAIGLPGAADGHRIHVAVVGDPADSQLPPQLWRRARGRLPSYMMPAGIHVLAALPHNPNGKVDEARLRATIAACIAVD